MAGRVVRGMRRSAGPGQQVIAARLVEQPAIASDEGLFAAIAQPGELRELKPRTERPGDDAGVFEVVLIGAEIRRRRFPPEHFQCADAFAPPELDGRLNEKPAGHHDEEGDDQDEFRRPAHARTRIGRCEGVRPRFDRSG